MLYNLFGCARRQSRGERVYNECGVPLVDVGGDAEVAGAQLAAHLLDLQLHCNANIIDARSHAQARTGTHRHARTHAQARTDTLI